MKNEKLRDRKIFRKNSAKRIISPRLIFFACCMIIVPVLFIACDYSNKPGVVYPEASLDTTGRPTITGITPVSGAIAGVREITISGSSLGIKNGTDTPWVMIGGVHPIIKQITNAFITMYRPKLSNDHYDKSIYVSVTEPKMMTISSSMTYSVQTPGVVTGDYSVEGTMPLGGSDFDSLENIYTVVNKSCYKIDFAGVTRTQLLNAGNFTSSNDANSPPFICFGPGSNNKNLFVVPAGKSFIFRLAVYDTMNSKNKAVKLPVPSAVNTMDFDDQGNVYTAGDGNLYVADKSVGDSLAPIFTSISGYAGVTSLKKIRVVSSGSNKYIYIADSLHVWKGQLTGTSLAMGSPVVDLNSHSELHGCSISSFEVDVNGSIFLCLLHYPKFSLFFAETDGSITPFYSDPNILPNTVDKLVWGNSNYLYLFSSTLQSGSSYAAGRVYRMVLDRNGALYGGRKFVH
jgi:hypothetical protein